MRILTIAFVAAGLVLGIAGTASAQSGKKKQSAWCDQMTCVKACTSRGGVVARCPDWCQNRIKNDARCK